MSVTCLAIAGGFSCSSVGIRRLMIQSAPMGIYLWKGSLVSFSAFEVVRRFAYSIAVVVRYLYNGLLRVLYNMSNVKTYSESVICQVENDLSLTAPHCNGLFAYSVQSPVTLITTIVAAAAAVQCSPTARPDQVQTMWSLPACHIILCTDSGVGRAESRVICLQEIIMNFTMPHHHHH